MKKSKKKLLSLIAAIGITGGILASPLNQVTANAVMFELKKDQLYVPIEGNYAHAIKFKLRGTQNVLYKAWWQLQLVVRDGKLKLEGPSNIPTNLTFDDTFFIRVVDTNGKLKYLYRTEWDTNSDDREQQLKEMMAGFDKANVGLGDKITITGQRWKSTVLFTKEFDPLIQTSNNNYADGFENVNKYNVVFEVTNKGLKEVKEYWWLDKNHLR